MLKSIYMINGRPWCLFDWTWHGDTETYGPGAFSWFHFMWLAICIAGTFCLIYFVARKHDKKKDLLVCRCFAIGLFTFEMIKIVNECIYNGKFRASDFPFDFCSLPIYLLAIASFFKDSEKIVPKTCIKLATYFGFVGGLAVMCYPAATLSDHRVWYSIHTMLWHSSLVAYSMYFFASMEFGKKFKEELIPVGIGFLGVTLLAITLNEILYYTYCVPTQNTDKVNFFWISSHYKTEYPVLSIIKEKAPYIVFLLMFIITVSLIIVIMHFSVRLIKYHTFHTEKLDNKKTTDKENLLEEKKKD